MTHATTSTQLTIAGAPRGKGRPRFVKATGRTYTDQRTQSAEARVRDAWVLADRPDLGDGPLAMTLVVVVERPAGHLRVHGGLTKAGERKPVPTSRPDLDNVLKLVADALNGLAYHDDAQIAVCSVARRWATEGERAHLEVALRCIGPRLSRTAPSIPQDAAVDASDDRERRAAA